MGERDAFRDFPRWMWRNRESQIASQRYAVGMTDSQKMTAVAIRGTGRLQLGQVDRSRSGDTWTGLTRLLLRRARRLRPPVSFCRPPQITAQGCSGTGDTLTQEVVRQIVRNSIERNVLEYSGKDGGAFFCMRTQNSATSYGRGIAILSLPCTRGPKTAAN